MSLSIGRSTGVALAEQDERELLAQEQALANKEKQDSEF
jgi:hypothetical protein